MRKTLHQLLARAHRARLLLAGRARRRRFDRQTRNDLISGVPIVGFTGINGAGKTLMAVRSAVAYMAKGGVVYSTVPIRSRYGNSRPVVSLRQLLTLSNCMILLDEVAVMFSSRSTGSLPAEIVVLIQTLRHHGITLVWTAPSWMRADNQLRDVTQAVVNVIPLAKVDNGTPWRRPRLVACALLDTSQGKVDAAPTKLLRRRIYAPMRQVSWGAYDSLADTPMFAGHLRGGVCVDCGGSMERPKHTKARHEAMHIPFFEDDVLRTAQGPVLAGALTDPLEEIL